MEVVGRDSRVTEAAGEIVNKDLLCDGIEILHVDDVVGGVVEPQPALERGGALPKLVGACILEEGVAHNANVGVEGVGEVVGAVSLDTESSISSCCDALAFCVKCGDLAATDHARRTIFTLFVIIIALFHAWASLLSTKTEVASHFRVAVSCEIPCELNLFWRIGELFAHRDAIGEVSNDCTGKNLGGKGELGRGLSEDGGGGCEKNSTDYRKLLHILFIIIYYNLPCIVLLLYYFFYHC